MRRQTSEARRSTRTEHLERLPDRLLVEDVVAGVRVVAVLDALHVLDNDEGGDERRTIDRREAVACLPLAP